MRGSSGAIPRQLSLFQIFGLILGLFLAFLFVLNLYRSKHEEMALMRQKALRFKMQAKEREKEIEQMSYQIKQLNQMVRDKDHRITMLEEARYQKTDILKSGSYFAPSGNYSHQPFVVLFDGQSGSSWLMKLFAQLANVLVSDDIAADSERDRTLLEATRDFLSGVGKHFKKQAAKEDVQTYRAVGYRRAAMTLKHENRTHYFGLLKTLNAKVVCLYRSNRFQAVAARYRATHCPEKKSNAASSSKCSLDVDKISRMVTDKENSDSFLFNICRRASFSGLNVFQLFFEELLYNKKRMLEELLQFLGIPKEELKTINLDSIAFKHSDEEIKSFLNYKRIINYYKQGPYKRMIEGNEPLLYLPVAEYDPISGLQDGLQ